MSRLTPNLFLLSLAGGRELPGIFPVPHMRTTAKQYGGPLPRRGYGKLPTLIEGTYWKGDGVPSRMGTNGVTRQMRRRL